MDVWMNGEVLIIGIMVGWSGGVPKGPTSCGDHESHSLFYEDVFSKAFFSIFCRFWVDLGRILGRCFDDFSHFWLKSHFSENRVFP